METTEKIILAACIFAGFLWLRGRARALDLSRSKGRTVFGIFGVLAGLLLGIKYAFDNWHFGAYADVAIQAAAIAASFALVGYVFLKPDGQGDAAGEGDGPPPRT